MRGSDRELPATGGASAESTFVIQAAHNVIAVAAAKGKPRVTIFDAAAHAPLASFYAFAKSFRGGVRVATGDVNGDGVIDVAIAGGPGRKSTVSIYDGTKLHLVGSNGVISPAALLMQFSPFGKSDRGGAYVAIAELTGDSTSDIIVGSGIDRVGEVRIYSGASGQLIRSFKPFGRSYRQGVTVAGGDLNGDGSAEIATARATSGSQVKVFDGASGVPIVSMKPFGNGVAGVDMAIGDLNGDGRKDLVVSAGPGSTPQVRGYSGVDYGLIADFLAYSKRFRGGVQIGTLDRDGDGVAEILAGDGDGGGPYVRIFQSPGVMIDQLFAKDRNFPDGVTLD